MQVIKLERGPNIGNVRESKSVCVASYDVKGWKLFHKGQSCQYLFQGIFFCKVLALDLHFYIFI